MLKEMERIAKKYEDIIKSINREIRREGRKFLVRKNVLPVKFILPREYIERLLTWREFKRVWERKVFWIHVLDEWCDPPKYKWFKVKTFPNIGGIPVEEGKELKVIMMKFKSRKRKKNESK